MQKAKATPGEEPSPTASTAATPMTTSRLFFWLQIFALTIFCSAFLLFQVQPLIAKFILPWFGGGPGVWTTCLLFFQVLLLGGYAYAHLSVRWLPLRGQALIHLGLLITAVLCLPITPDASWKPVDANHPVFRILSLLMSCLGLPYFVLAATGPLLQAWFNRIHPSVLPYRLYAVSNAGSLLALLSYPFVFEPVLSRQVQARVWSCGLGALAMLSGVCALGLWNCRAVPASFSGSERGLTHSLVANATKCLWVGLAGSAFVLLLATTNKICQDTAIVPFLWVLPLGLYLLSFILCFDSSGWYRRRWYGWALYPVLGLAGFVLSASTALRLPLVLQVGAYSLALFVCCMICHGELYRLKPPPLHLTSFYLLIAVGGALGGVFVGLAAPWLFDSYLELPLGWLISASLVAFIAWRERSIWQLRGFSLRLWVVGALGVTALAGLLMIYSLHTSRQVISRARNFYGVLRILDFLDNGPAFRSHVLVSGEITHGFQFVDPNLASIPTGYYYESSGIGLAFQHLPRPENRRVGIVGLGIGTLAAYGRPGDLFRFYEINPDVKRLAQTCFSYLTGATARVEILMGDGRVSLEREPPQAFDLLVLDAFSADAIPIHLLTREAFDIYLRHLKSDGVLAVHITNRHLDLLPVIAQLAAHSGLQWALIEIQKNPREGAFFETKWTLMARDEAFLQQKAIRQFTQTPVRASSRVELWTDDYASLLPILKW